MQHLATRAHCSALASPPVATRVEAFTRRSCTSVARPKPQSFLTRSNMRTLSLIAALALTTLGAAQSPLLTLSGGTNQGNVGGGIYFDLQINQTVTITRIDFLCGANTAAGTGTMNIWLGPTTYLGNVANPSLWAMVGSATATVGPSTMVQGTLTAPFALAPGNYGVALQSSNHNFGYTNGVGCTSTSTPGACTNSTFTNAQMTIRAGAAQNAFLAGGVFTPRIFNGAIHYTLGGTPIAVAAWQPYDKGCYAYYRSFYQLFPNPVGLNLGITGGVPNPVTAFKLVLNQTRAGYDVIVTNTPVAPPTSPPITLAGPDLTFSAAALFPNQQLPFGIPHPLAGGMGFANDLNVSTEGYIVPAPASIPNDGTPTTGELLGALAPRWAAHWKNMNPAASGSSMHVEYDAIAGELLVTWNNVADAAATTTSTFQVAFSFNGDVEYRYGAMSQNGGGTYPIVIGWSEGNGSLDPGNIEIATALPLSTYNVDNPPLTLGLGQRPRLGSNLVLDTSRIPTGTGAGVIALGFTQITPGLDLGMIGAPNCRMAAVYDATVTVGITGSTHQLVLGIPNIPALNGGLLFGQSVTVSPGFNALGVITSNGVRIFLGSI